MQNLKYLLILLLLPGCYTAKKATEQIKKADNKFPEVVAKLARDKYPCTDLLKNDTAVIWRDSVVFIDCPEIAPNEFERVVIKTDTVNNVITKTVRVPVRVQLPTQVVTKWYEDSAKLKMAAVAADKLAAENTGLKSKLESTQGKLTTRTKYLWWLLALCAGLTVWNFRKLFI